MESRDDLVNRLSPPQAKIALFRSLFRGREDVYPLRFVSRKTGRAGYQPACANEWVRGVCEKPRIKCGDCAKQAFLKVTDETIRWHLSGKDGRGGSFVMGAYPMLLDETCFFLAADFDKESWQDDAGAFLETCRAMKLPAALERSRSGNGAHVWLFFQEAIPAAAARNLGSAILTATMERRPAVGLKSYDRFFPNQDTLPKGGFGNLIALPLQKEPRSNGNSVFLDDRFHPHADQWAFLSSMQKIRLVEIEPVVKEAARKGAVLGVRLALSGEDDDEPWSAPPSRRRKESEISGPFPKKIELVLGEQIYVPKEGLSPSLQNRLIRIAAFQNPDFYKAQAMRLSTHDKPRIIGCAEDHPLHIALPRGCLEEAQALLKSVKVKTAVRDERCQGVPLEVAFQGQLNAEQQAAVREIMAFDMGILSAPPAFGKTVAASWLIARRGVNALIVVHRQALLDQWIERLSSFLNTPAKDIGRIGGGRRKATGKLDVALIQSLVRNSVVDDRVADYGHLIIDECHHLSAVSFEAVARRAKARFVLGLSATLARKDGHHPIIFMQCGPARYRADAKAQAAARPFRHNVIVRPTGFRADAEESEDPRIVFHSLYEQLISDDKRNALICDDVLAALRENRSPVVLTERTEHLDRLSERLSQSVKHVIVLRGGMKRKQRMEQMERLSQCAESGGRVILATGAYLGEGFDDPRLDTLFLTLPVSWRGTIAQYAGRLHRLHEGKKEARIYDYADLDTPMLARMFERRCQGYEAVGYTICLPASAVPGWPPEVPLPVDPQWKRDYGGSVQRLIRDGVDAFLGNLFVHAARNPSAEAEGVERARSASEAFLFQRLETLPDMKGRFQLNKNLPIPFGGQGQMEVDFLCEEAGLVVELDGDQHLSDANAYRSDRRKDALLQERGYFVLRFLATDAGKNLNEILDTITRALEHRRIKIDAIRDAK